jgi:hypothetical protein
MDCVHLSFDIVCASRVELFFLAGTEQKKKREMEDDPLKPIQAGRDIKYLPQSFFFFFFLSFI